LKSYYVHLQNCKRHHISSHKCHALVTKVPATARRRKTGAGLPGGRCFSSARFSRRDSWVSQRSTFVRSIGPYVSRVALTDAAAPTSAPARADRGHGRPAFVSGGFESRRSSSSRLLGDAPKSRIRCDRSADTMPAAVAGWSRRSALRGAAGAYQSPRAAKRRGQSTRTGRALADHESLLRTGALLKQRPSWQACAVFRLRAVRALL